MDNVIVKFRVSIFSKTLYFLNIVFGSTLNTPPSVLFNVVWLSVIAIMSPLSASAAAANATPTISGTHWVVVIRNTISMDLKRREALVDTLPKLMFQGSAGDSGTRVKLPTFNPDHDHLSLVFASIHDAKNYYRKKGAYPLDCLEDLKERDRSAKLEHFFIVRELYKSVNSKLDLDSLLNKWLLNDPCLFNGFDFNEYIAENAVMPHLSTKQSQTANTINTIIVLVNNTKGSLSLDEPNQISEFEESYKVARNFRTDYITVNPADWIFTVFSDYKINDNKINMGLGLDSGSKEILIRYMISKATYIPEGDKTSKSLCFGLDEYLCIVISILIAAACIGPLLMYYYMRSRNRICIPE